MLKTNPLQIKTFQKLIRNTRGGSVTPGAEKPI